eukprot:m.437149 g.437149  ORF g.437149 m.437149 type:complete len:536 (+) comp21433_c0_seq4:238-1845(+)
MSDLRPGAHRNETAAERSVRRASEARAQRKEQSVALRKDKRAKHMELKRTRRAPPMDAILQSNVMAGSPESSGSSANCAVPIAADATGEHTAMDDIDLDNDISDEELDITVKSLVDTLRKFKEATRQRTLGVIGDYLQRGSRYVEAYIRHDIKLGAMLRALNTPQTQLQACWCISNIAASISSHTREASVASPYLITFLGSENAYLQDHSATAVANIAGDSPSCRDQLIAQGAISPVISLIASRSADVVRSAAFALSNLLRGQALDLRQRMNATLMPAMIKAFETFVAQSNYDVITELLWVLTYFCVDNPVAVASFVETTLIHTLFSILVDSAAPQCPYHHQVSPLLRVLGNILGGPEEYIRLFTTNAPVLRALLVHLSSPLHHIRSECAWVVANIAGGGPEHGKALLEGNFVPALGALLESGNADLQREALFALLGTAHHNVDVLDAVVSATPVVPSIIRLLPSPDIEIQLATLQFIEMLCRMHPHGVRMVDESDGPSYLEAQQYHANQEVSWRVTDILTRYFEDYDDEEIDMD